MRGFAPSAQSFRFLQLHPNFAIEIFRVDFDEGRGGFGKLAQKEIDEQYGSLDNDPAEGPGGPGGMLVMGEAKRRRTGQMQDGYGGSRRSSGPVDPPPPPPPKESARERDEPENPRFKEREEDDD